MKTRHLPTLFICILQSLNMVVCRFSVLCYILWCLSVSLPALAADDLEATILTPHIKSGNITHARSLSKVFPANFLGLESYSGFLTVKEEYDSNLFFWYFPHTTPYDVPWVIWLQGGPGYSSMLGVFEGIGPLQIDEGKLKLRNHTWASNYSLVFVDNPVGAGFSYTGDERGYTTNEEDVAAQLLEFLKQFLVVFPEVQQAPLFLAGASYAGKYVPAFGHYIHKDMSVNQVNFRGIAIGNGLIDPKSQLLKGHSALCDALGLLSDEELTTLEHLQQQCVDNIDQGKMIDAANKFNESIEFIKEKSGVNIYNFDRDPSRVAPSMEEFLSRTDVRGWIHVGTVPFELNNQRVYRAMLPDIMNTTKPFVEELLEHYGVLNYNGQLDVILPYSLAKSFYSELKWSKRQEYRNANRIPVYENNGSSGFVVGYRKSGGNLVDVLIRRAGHQATKDQPQVCKSIMGSFTDEYK